MLTTCLCLLQVRYCLKNLREQMAAKTKVPKICRSLNLFSTSHPVGFMAFPFTSFIIPAMVLFFSADFLSFFMQPHTNGWKVGIPFRKNGLSAPKTDGQVSRKTHEQALLQAAVGGVFFIRVRLLENILNLTFVASAHRTLCKAIRSQRHKQKGYVGKRT